MALVDLPLAQRHNHEFIPDESSGIVINVACNAVLFKKQIKEAPNKLNQDIMVIHRYRSIDRNKDKES